MATFGQRLKELRTEKKMTQSDIGKLLNVSNVSVSGYENDTREPDQQSLKKLANYFNVSIDYLLGQSDKRHYYDLTEKDQKAIDAQLEEIVQGLSDKSGVSFLKNNAELSDHDRELLIVSLRQSLALARQMAKKKFTPKKYRDSDSSDID